MPLFPLAEKEPNCKQAVPEESNQYQTASFGFHSLSRKAYRGKVSVAINGVSMSASVMFSSWIQTTGRGVLYGEMCMGGHKGTFGDAVQLKLKHSKIPFNMSTVKITPLVTADATTSGIVPDVLLKPTITQLKNGIDPIKEVLGFYKKNITKIK